ncbi:unnamed protein product [Brassicogethes aeneus]|uniref:Rab-like protein 3 n=1 Tax=Brassicogethes aeneus TaxID=1431903 RepID=A0A9P0AXY0_BRAAE|nr:unnamed protein product [Brassicogethes aeneus]
MSAIERVRIVVLGDSGVGKTSFVHLAAHNKPLKSPSWTVGCSVEVKLHEFKEGTKEQKTFFVELWDVGGSNNHRNARQVFYNPCHGLILVHDLSNIKSEENLNKWLQEVLYRDVALTSVCSNDEYDSESFLGASQIPILVIGTKLDQADDKKPNRRKFANEVGADEIILDCRGVRYLAAATTNAVKLSRFYDRVIEQSIKYSSTYSGNSISSSILPSKFYSPHQD